MGYGQSALDGRCLGAAFLADGLVVLIDHPFIEGTERSDLLVGDLQANTRAFQPAHRFPIEGQARQTAGAAEAG